MRTILITGGTSFVSGQAASYYAQRGERVYVLIAEVKCNHREQD